MPIDKDAPRLRTKDGEGDDATLTSIRSLPDITGDERLYALLANTVAAMTAGGVRAEEAYRAALEAVRDDEAFVAVTVRTAEALDEDSYQERWALTQLAIDLEHPAAVHYLGDLVRRPVPEERAEDPSHGLSTVTEEVILRTTAIEGLARLQRRDIDTADVLLDTITSSDYVSLRRAAWFALLDGGRQDAAERAKAILVDRGDGWITELRRMPVEEAPQADPRLIGRGKRRRDEVPTPFDE
jgi:hypothetical protein